MGIQIPVLDVAKRGAPLCDTMRHPAAGSSATRPHAICDGREVAAAMAAKLLCVAS
jgi:hypothetical protein